MEYISASSSNGFIYNYDVTIQYFDKFYDLFFETSSRDQYAEHIKEVRNVIHSIKFIPENMNIQRPSFLISE
ncbi:MAG: hypothetical protein ACPKQO_00420 [Nitrososphaeraceae archaeon]